jgi:hypothetical protein
MEEGVAGDGCDQVVGTPEVEVGVCREEHRREPGESADVQRIDRSQKDSEQRDNRHHEPQRGQQAERPPAIEVREPDRPVRHQVFQQDGRDDESRDDKEDVNSGEPAAHANPRVVGDDKDDCECAKALDVCATPLGFHCPQPSRRARSGRSDMHGACQLQR